MKRYSIAPRIGTGVQPDNWRPDLTDLSAPTAYAAPQYTANHVLVKCKIADGTAKVSTANSFTLADLLLDGTDYETATLTAGQRNTIGTWITSHYPALSTNWTNAGVTTRQGLLLWVAQQIFGSSLTLAELRTKEDAD